MLINQLRKDPCVEESIVPIMFKNVVFPPPDGPLMMTNYPLFIAPYGSDPDKLTVLNATTGLSPLRLYYFPKS